MSWTLRIRISAVIGASASRKNTRIVDGAWLSRNMPSAMPRPSRNLPQRFGSGLKALA